jgi:hypothetical protein
VPGVKEIDTGKIRQLIIAGWTGRNQEAVEKHIRELEAIGVRRPKSTPIFYRVSASLLTTDDMIDVLGENSSGEVECVLHAIDGEIFVGVGSDHTDRKAEAIGVSLSKQMCAKPVSRKAWRYDDVAPHWDALMLRSYIRVNGERRLYQEGSVSAMRPPEELCRLWGGDSRLPQRASMFCGTLAVHGGIVSADTFEMELEDPVLDRRITHVYGVRTLPDEG